MNPDSKALLDEIQEMFAAQTVAIDKRLAEQQNSIEQRFLTAYEILTTHFAEADTTVG